MMSWFKKAPKENRIPYTPIYKNSKLQSRINELELDNKRLLDELIDVTDQRDMYSHRSYEELHRFLHSRVSIDRDYATLLGCYEDLEKEVVHWKKIALDFKKIHH